MNACTSYAMSGGQQFTVFRPFSCFYILSAPSSTMSLSLSATEQHLRPACAPCCLSAHRLPGIKLCLLSAVNPAVNIYIQALCGYISVTGMQQLSHMVGKYTWKITRHIF